MSINLLSKIGVASTTSIIVTEAVNLEPLWNALITLALSIVSVLAVEGVNWLKNYIIKHTAKVDEDKDKEDNGK